MPDDPGESQIIEALLSARPAPPPVPLQVDAGDDAAVLPGGLVVATDAMVEGVHWDGRLDAADVGWKLLAVNVSDLAAMGAAPTWCTLAVSLPRPLDLTWVERFSAGLAEGCATWGVHLVGGDVTRSPGPRALSLTLGGQAAAAVTRSGARPGDQLWVTGRLGAAAAGFFHGGPGLDALRRPRPPLSYGLALASAGVATAMMDLSDGLARDLPRMCAASGVGATVDADALPAPGYLAAHPDALSLQVAFGEDYQLLFTAAARDASAIAELARDHGVQATPIGRIEAAPGARLSSGPWPAPRFSHFPTPPAATC